MFKSTSELHQNVKPNKEFMIMGNNSLHQLSGETQKGNPNARGTTINFAIWMLEILMKIPPNIDRFLGIRFFTYDPVYINK